MQTPENGQQLQQFLCAFQWVKSALPEFSNLIEPLHLFMETVHDANTSRKRTAVARIQLRSVGWGEEHDDTFNRCKRTLSHKVTLVHSDPNKQLCVYTDASDMVWSGVNTQVPVSEANKPHAEKRHETLAFLSGRFDYRQSRWSILEKEGLAIPALISPHAMACGHS